MACGKSSGCKTFLDYLAGNEAGAVFTRHDFIILPADNK